MERCIDPVLMRTGGLPVRYWLAAANTGLFEMVDELEAATEGSTAHFKELAYRIGDELVPNVAIERRDRAFLLNIRRRLHGAQAISQGEARRAISLARGVGAHDLAAELVRCDERGEQLGQLAERLECVIEAEMMRLLNLPSHIASDSSVAHAILEGLGSLPGDERRRRFLKRRLRFFERSWQLITRAATNPTPRGWMSHLGLMTDRSSATNRIPFPSIDAECYVHWTESVRARRRAEVETQDSAWPAATDKFAVNPLRWSEEGEHVSIVLDHHVEPSCVVMRETEMLRRILESVNRGTRTFAQLCDDLGVFDEAQHDKVRSFLQHLRNTGVVQAVVVPNSTLTKVGIGGGTAIPQAVSKPGDGWIDIYRRVEPGLAMSTHLALHERLHHALRVLQLIDPYYRCGDHRSDDAKSWTFADILKASLVRGPAEHSDRRATERSASKAAVVSGAAQLLEYVRAHANETEVLSVPLDLIDEIDCNTPGEMWPVDCLIRVPESEASYRLVVTGVWPAGTIDSRFSDGLEQAFGFTSWVNDYRSFLRQVEALTGIAFVEVLAPPLSEHADNAVRRPAYTSKWTGDPNRDLYLVGAEMTEEYVSPHDIVVRFGPGGMQSWLHGRRIWPVYHATRSFSPPWDRISHTLLATSLLSVPPTYRRPHTLIMPSRTARRVPRIVLDQDIVLCPAQWMLVDADLWDARDRLATKVRRLTRARRHLGLPRWVQASDAEESFTVACDLESIASIRLIDRIISQHGAFRATEMLPTPEQFLLHDKGHFESDRLSSEMVIRMPSPDLFPSLAERVAREIAASAG